MEGVYNVGGLATTVWMVGCLFVGAFKASTTYSLVGRTNVLGELRKILHIAHSEQTSDNFLPLRALFVTFDDSPRQGHDADQAHQNLFAKKMPRLDLLGPLAQEQVLVSALPDVQQTTADNRNASCPHLSKRGSHEVSPLHPDLEGSVIPSELLEADSAVNAEQSSNEPCRVATDAQLSEIVGENLNEGDLYEENFEHCRFFFVGWEGNSFLTPMD